jgi:heme exporter protein D
MKKKLCVTAAALSALSLIALIIVKVRNRRAYR